MQALKTSKHAKNQVYKVLLAHDYIIATFNKVIIPLKFEKKSKLEI